MPSQRRRYNQYFEVDLRSVIGMIFAKIKVKRQQRKFIQKLLFVIKHWMSFKRMFRFIENITVSNHSPAL